MNENCQFERIILYMTRISLWRLQMNLTTSRAMRIWKIEWLNMARRRSEIRIDSDNDHDDTRVHTQAKIR